MIIQKAAFAALAGVSRAAIGQGVKKGLLVETPDGMIDTAAGPNAAYLAGKKAAARKADGRQAPDKASHRGPPARPVPIPTHKGPPANPVPIPPAAPPPPDLDGEAEGDPDNERGGLYIRKLKAEIRFKHEAAEAHRLRRMERMGLLVEREQVRKIIGDFNAELRIRLLELPQAIAPRALALAKTGAVEHELVALFEDEIARAIDGAKGIIERSKVIGA